MQAGKVHISEPSTSDKKTDWAILVIDDEPVLRLTFKHMLESRGYEVWVAKDGEEGLEIFRRLHPDLVITDIVMPGQDGFATIANLRRENPGLPIIAMSAVMDPEDIEKPMDCGATCYLTKPVDMEALDTMIQSILQANHPGVPDGSGNGGRHVSD